jgi:putative two-component system response regulator
MAIADVYDALISKRVYKPPLSHLKAVKIMLQGDSRTAPGHFDPDMLQAFAQIQDQFLQIAFDYSDSEEERKALLEQD